MKNLARSFALFCFALTAVYAQPTITNVQDAAGYDTEITRGAIAIVKGSGLGPGTLIKADAFPLLTTFNGASVKVTVNGTTVDGIMFYTWDQQSAFILPSATPSGQGTLVFTYNGQSSAQFPVTVVDRNPQVYTANASGSGAGVATFHSSVNRANPFIGNDNAVNPGHLVILWMQGLGPVDADETIAAPAIQFPEVPIRLFIGSLEISEFVYAGRSPGCCTAVDNLFFYWPSSGVTNTCAVDIRIEIGSQISNTTTIPAADSGPTCSNNPNNGGGGNGGGGDGGTFESLFTVNDISKWSNQSSVKGGVITLNSSRNISIFGIPGGQTFEQESSSQDGSGGFYQVNLVQASQVDITDAVRELVGGQVGACTTFTYEGFDIPDDISLDPSQFNFRTFSAGDISLMGGFGTRMFEQLSFAGLVGYSLELSTELSQGGSLTITATGSSDVDPFTGTVTSPGNFQVTNLAALRKVSRSNIVVNWTPVSSGVVTISGTTRTGGIFDGVIKSFECVAAASAGTFTVPSATGLYLDATDGFADGSSLSVTYGYYTRIPSNLDFLIVGLDNDVTQSTDFD